VSFEQKDNLAALERESGCSKILGNRFPVCCFLINPIRLPVVATCGKGINTVLFVPPFSVPRGTPPRLLPRLFAARVCLAYFPTLGGGATRLTLTPGLRVAALHLPGVIHVASLRDAPTFVFNFQFLTLNCLVSLSPRRQGRVGEWKRVCRWRSCP
jgi:hypothetical protein